MDRVRGEPYCILNESHITAAILIARRIQRNHANDGLTQAFWGHFSDLTNSTFKPKRLESQQLLILGGGRIRLFRPTAFRCNERLFAFHVTHFRVNKIDACLHRKIPLQIRL